MTAANSKPPCKRGSSRSRSGGRGPGEVDLLLSVWVAFVFAVAQPLLDLLGRGAEFLVAHRTSALDVLILAISLTVLVPLLCGVVVVAVRRSMPRIGASLHAVLFGGLVALLGLQLLVRAPLLSSMPGSVMVLLAAIVGALGVMAFYRLAGARILLRVLSPAPLLFAGIFLFVSPVRALILPPVSPGERAATAIQRPAPIVIIVFDEMPLTSLMDERGEIDRSRYPNFWRLSRKGIWFRNATTQHPLSQEAVPALLSGLYPKPGGRVPSLSSHPDNLFTLLGRGYDMRTYQTYTDLCPPELCPSRANLPRPFSHRWGSLVSDLAASAPHLFLPRDLTSELPPIEEALGHIQGGDELPEKEGRGAQLSAGQLQRRGEGPTWKFEDGTKVTTSGLVGAGVAGREALVDEFLASIRPTPRPPLFYLHVLLPHKPYVYLPTGQRYRCPAGIGRNGQGWGPDPWAVRHQYQRHLLQVGYVDGILGRVLERLERAGLYEDALIIVTSDHGEVFRPGVEHVRLVRRDTVPWIAPVPLFVKTPGHGPRGIDERPVELIDVLPTIAGVIGAKVPWRTDGWSVFDEQRSRKNKVIYDFGNERRIYFGTSGREKLEALEEKTKVFKDGPFAAAPDGYGELVGQPLERVPRAGEASLWADVDGQSMLRDVDPGATALPACISGRLRPRPAASSDLAVAVNGKVHAVTRTDEDGKFAAMIPPRAFRRGVNDLRLGLLSKGRAPSFSEVPTK